MASNESEKMSTTQVENNRSLASKNRYNPTGRTKKMMFTKPIPTVALMLVTVTCLLCHVTGNSFGASVSISGGGGGGGAPGLPTSCGNCDMLKMMSIFGSHEDQMEGGKAVADECFGVKEEDHVLHFRACGDQKYRNECYVGKCLRELQEEYGDELKTNDATTHCDKWIETPSFICEETPFEIPPCVMEKGALNDFNKCCSEKRVIPAIESFHNCLRACYDSIPPSASE